MFRKLKFKFSFTNLWIVAALFFLIITAAYFYFQANMLKNAKFYTERLAFGINFGLIQDWPKCPGSTDDQELAPNRKEPLNKPQLFDIHLLTKPLLFDNSLPIDFFVKIGLDGIITSHSSNQPFDQKRLTMLAQLALIMKKNNGIINFRSYRYFYYKTPLPKQPGMLIVFHDLKQEANALYSLLRFLIIAGICCLILAVIRSIFVTK